VEEEPEEKPSFQLPVEKEKTCAFSGCDNRPFGGGKYCVSHQNADKKTTGGGGGGGGAGAPRTMGAGAAGQSTRNLGGGGGATGGGGGGGGMPAKKAAPAPVGSGRPMIKSQPVKANMQPIPKYGNAGGAGRAAGGASSAGGGGGGMYGGGAAAGRGRGAGGGGGGGGGMYGGGGGGDSSGGGGASQPRMSIPKAPAPVKKAAPAKKKCEWAKVYDEGSGQYYFWNEKTEESVWEQPPGFY